MVRVVKKYLNDLVARFQFWNAKKEIQINEDFEFYDSEESLFFIRIKRGMYEGVVFSISNMKVREDSDGNALLDFETNIHESPIKNLDCDDKKFIRYINNVVRILLSEAVGEAQKYEQRGTVDSIESDEEREVYEESTSVSESSVSKRSRRKKVVDRDSEVSGEVQQPAKRRSPSNNRRKSTKSE